jgi:hypothetical protein
MARTRELNLFGDLPSACTDLLRLIEPVHLYGAAEVCAARGNAMKSILLAKDEDALVVDELRALAELIDSSDFEPLWVFVEDVWDEGTKKRVRLAAYRQQSCAKTKTRDQFAPEEIGLTGFRRFIR